MATDVPTVVYHNKKDKKKGLSQAQCAKLLEEWNARKAKREKPLSLDEFLKQ